MATYTYDLATDIGKMRFLCRDNNMWRTGKDDRRDESCFFTDEELQAALDLTTDMWGAAILALGSLLADDRKMTTARKIGNWSENYADMRQAIEALIGQYKLKSDEYAPTILIQETAYSQKSVDEYIRRGKDVTNMSNV